MTNPKHTDTSRSGDLVEMLADAVFTGTGVMKDGKHVPIEDVYLDPRDARIEALEAEVERLTLRLAECAAAGSTMRQTIVEFHAENERLREALRCVTPPAHFGESEQAKAWWAKARAALGEG